MTTDDLETEIRQLREKAHSLSNLATNHEGRILTIESTMEEQKSVVNAVRDSLIVLESQSKILRWLLGVATAILVSVVVKTVEIL